MKSSTMCPKCKSQDVQEEMRLRNPNGKYSLGVWRISYGYASVGAVFLFGVFTLVSIFTWLPMVLLDAAMLITGLCLLFVLWVGIFTYRMSRWERFTALRCRQCDQQWEQ